MTKIDLFKLNKSDYIAAKKPVLIDIKEATYLVINGQGSPGKESFNDAVSALYAMAYTVKMTRKKQNKGDYVICKLEARYWSESALPLNQIAQEQWSWQLMIRTPEHVENSDIQQAAQALLSKGKTVSVENVSLCRHNFGRCIQMLHIGAFEEEKRTIEQMYAFAATEKLTPSSEHCEIYISDPRRVPPERLKTILRSPVTST
ncbi:MAG: GyrI-like domain-containing protein [Colwellia sp.]|nr:GyrI-like domain-containing protein [Colwellia sp.]